MLDKYSDTFRLSVGTFRQSGPGYCGPAALKIVLDYYGKTYSENALTKMLNATPETGADPAQIIKLAQSLGLKAYDKQNMTTQEIKNIVKSGVPVIANHTTPDPIGGHYAVIMGFSNDEFVISDPAEDSGYIVKKITDFMKDWYEKEDKTVRQGIIISL